MRTSRLQSHKSHPRLFAGLVGLGLAKTISAAIVHAVFILESSAKKRMDADKQRLERVKTLIAVWTGLSRALDRISNEPAPDDVFLNYSNSCLRVQARNKEARSQQREQAAPENIAPRNGSH